MSYTSAILWKPIEIDDLEPAAWDALVYPNSSCVVAGPGAGKTEFLAQRAAYLLQTRTCSFPYNILAISFKTSSAKNLSDRVRKRCSVEHNSRFKSLTFDALTKSLVDRFINAIPKDWRPPMDYEIIFPQAKDFKAFLQVTRTTAPEEYKEVIASLPDTAFESKVVGSYKLPRASGQVEDALSYVAQTWILENLNNPSGCKLTFVIINRIAELLLRERPQILNALRQTYPFVFVDEFQDTTYGQYDFLKTAFLNADCTITAVGDNKQRIMLWAGAREDAFKLFKREFKAVEFSLLFNFRSSPDLVKIQYVIARALDPQAKVAESQVKKSISGEVAQIWSFPNPKTQATQVAKWISDEMKKRATKPRDYAILVKQKAEDFEEQLEPAMTTLGLRIRNESKYVGKITLQELLSEELTIIVMSILRLCANKRHPESWSIVFKAYLHLNSVSVEDQNATHKAERKLAKFLGELKELMETLPPSKDGAKSLLDTVIKFLDLKSIATSFAEYSHGDWLALILESLRIHFVLSAKKMSTWNDCIDYFEGSDQIPLMTVHRSKGLEYDTIIFVGLDDAAWWSHSPGNSEGQSTFFVALSRAKQRAIFSFTRNETRKRVSDFYELLSKAGVQVSNF